MIIIPFRVGKSCISAFQYERLPDSDPELKAIADFVSGKSPFGILSVANCLEDETGSYPLVVIRVDNPPFLNPEEAGEALVTWAGKLSAHLPPRWGIIEEKLRFILGKHPDTFRPTLIYWVVFCRHIKPKHEIKEKTLNAFEFEPNEYWQ